MATRVTRAVVGLLVIGLLTITPAEAQQGPVCRPDAVGDVHGDLGPIPSPHLDIVNVCLDHVAGELRLDVTLLDAQPVERYVVARLADTQFAGLYLESSSDVTRIIDDRLATVGCAGPGYTVAGDTLEVRVVDCFDGSTVTFDSLWVQDHGHAADHLDGGPIGVGTDQGEPDPPPVDPAPPVIVPMATPVIDDDPASVGRVAVPATPPTALGLSRLRFADGTARHVLIARSDDFPDSLAGTALAGEGPLLYADTDAVAADVVAEVDRSLQPGGTVYLLGGEAALSEAVARTFSDRGHLVRRLAGETRLTTAVAVAREAVRLYGTTSQVLVARAGGPGSAGWADSITGGAWAAATGTPLVLADTAGIADDVAAFLAEIAPGQTVLLGGAAALSAAVETAVPNPRRIAGDGREDTAVAIAESLWGARDRFLLINGHADTDWRIGLAVAGLAAAEDAPLLVTNGADLTPRTAAALTERRGVTVIGDRDLVSAAVVRALGGDEDDGPPQGGGDPSLVGDGSQIAGVARGVAEEDAVAALTAILGPPTERRAAEPSPNPNPNPVDQCFARLSAATWDHLMVTFHAGTLTQWHTFGPTPSVATPSGVQVGMTVEELRAAHPGVVLEESFFDEDTLIGTIGANLEVSVSAAAQRVTVVTGGVFPCGE